MAYAHLLDIAAAGGVNGGTTTAVDTTGADFIALLVTEYFGSGSYPAAPTDSKGNTWTFATTTDNGTLVAGAGDPRIYYCPNPTVGSGHTFSIAGSTLYATVGGVAFSGSGASPLDAEHKSGYSAASGQPYTSGLETPATPSQNNCLFLAALSSGGGGTSAFSVDSGFTKACELAGTANNFGTCLAYLIQTTAAPLNPTMTGTGGTSSNVSQAIFKAAAGGGSNVTGTGGPSLSQIVAAGVGTLQINDSGTPLNLTMPQIAAAGAGTVSGGGGGGSNVSGSGAIAFPSLVASALGQVSILGAGAVTLPHLLVLGANHSLTGGGLSTSRRAFARNKGGLSGATVAPPVPAVTSGPTASYSAGIEEIDVTSDILTTMAVRIGANGGSAGTYGGWISDPVMELVHNFYLGPIDGIATGDVRHYQYKLTGQSGGVFTSADLTFTAGATAVTREDTVLATGRADSVLTPNPPTDGLGNYIISNGVFGIDTNAIYHVSGADGDLLLLDHSSPNMRVQIDFGALNPAVANPGIVARCKADFSTFLVAILAPNAVNIIEAGGAGSLTGSVATATNPTNGDYFFLDVDAAGNVKFWQNGVELVAARCTTALTAGNLGGKRHSTSNTPRVNHIKIS